ncbi:hypothetical protein RRF57_011377 [Xylaria bambusicola]|uniref:Uncharacterized protein n=1 Tax=Xylaria bambusicola TaxID=326684 RepID=A0AAN7UZG3_9PEZI
MLLRPFLPNAVIVWFVGQVSNGGVIIWTIRWNRSDDASALGFRDRFHGENADSGFVEGERRLDEGTDNLLPADFGDLGKHPPLWKDKIIVVGYVEDTVCDVRPNKTACLAVHGLGPKRCGYEIDLGGGRQSIDDRFGTISPFQDGYLDGRVLLHANSFSVATVMVQAGLLVKRRVHGISLPEFDLAEVLELVHLPPHKRVVVRVGIGGDKRTAPVGTHAEAHEIVHAGLRKNMDPVIGIGKTVDFLAWDAEAEHNLKLKLGLARLGDGFALVGLEYRHVGGAGGGPGGRGRSRGRGRGSGVGLGVNGEVLDVAFEVLAEHIHLADKLVGTRLDGHASAVEAERHEHTLAAHPGIAGGELDFGYGKAVADMKRPIHVRVSNGAEELGLLGTQVFGGDGVEGHIVGGWGGSIEDMVVCPLLLESLLDFDEDVTLLGLSKRSTGAQRPDGYAADYTHILKLTGFLGDWGLKSAVGSGVGHGGQGETWVSPPVCRKRRLDWKK